MNSLLRQGVVEALICLGAQHPSAVDGTAAVTKSCLAKSGFGAPVPLEFVVVDKGNGKACIPRGGNIRSEVGLRRARIERIGAEDCMRLRHTDRL